MTDHFSEDAALSLNKPDESNIYRMDGPTDFDYEEVSDDGSALDLVEPMYNDDGEVVGYEDRSNNNHLQKQPHAQHRRPPPIATEWENSVDQSIDDEHPMDNHPDSSTTITSSNMHFQDPKRYNPNAIYPTQSLRDENLRRQMASKHSQSSNVYNENALSDGGFNSLEETTPDFLRRAAQDAKNEVTVPPPPNSVMDRRERNHAERDTNTLESLSDIVHASIPDTSFYGADASALDGTFVSIRDLNDDDDVPSVDNERELYGAAKYSQWNPNDENGNGEFPTETTSLLGKGKLPLWQGGFFGSEVEKEDRRERLRMVRAKNGVLAGWLWSARSLLSDKGLVGSSMERNGAKSRGGWWDVHHPIGGDLASYTDAQLGGGFARQRAFSVLVIGVLCFHMALCGIHDIFLRYLSYRNPEEAFVSWNGEGRYIPAYWVTLEGRVMNPCIGPGPRTLTAFGALVPGIVLSKGQIWRAGTALFESSSFLQLLLHICVLKTAVGGSLTGLEWKRGTFVVTSLYLITAMAGSAWSIALEPGRLITSSEMGIVGLLAATIVEQHFSPISFKDDDDGVASGIGSNQNDIGRGPNKVSSSSNEQFTFQPVSRKRRRFPTLNVFSPLFLLTLELLGSWWAAYSSLIGSVTASIVGASCALILFVGNPSDSTDLPNDLLFTETPPPPPTYIDRGMFGEDDDSADTSIGASRQAYNTPLMRRSIFNDEDEEDEQTGSKSVLRKRKSDANHSSMKTPGFKGRLISINPYKKQPFSASRVIGRVVGTFLSILLTLIPASLIAAGDDPSNELTRASVLGCKPMRAVYKEDSNDELFECAGGCIPLSRVRVAKRSEGMREGRCDSIGYRCFFQTGTMILRSYEVDVGVYVVPTSDGSCVNLSEDNQSNEVYKNNDDANVGAGNGEIEGVQQN